MQGSTENCSVKHGQSVWISNFCESTVGISKSMATGAFFPEKDEIYKLLGVDTHDPPRIDSPADANVEIPVQALTEAGTREIPPAFLLQEEDESVPNQEAQYPIPVIDIAALVSRDAAECEKFAKACEWGVFQLVNHGISHELLDRLIRASLEYFAMPPEDRLIDSGLTFGGSACTRDWVDSLIFYPKPPRPDRTPRTKWPEGFREAVAEYSEEAPKLWTILLAVMSENLGLKSSRLKEALGEIYSTLRVNYYPPCPQPDLVRGMVAHSDACSMTFIIQNDVPGLQFCKNEKWVTARPLPHAILTNLGDLVEILSNGRYNSCEHRVLANSKSARMSIPHFFNPEPSTFIEPLLELVDDTHPPLYQRIHFIEYFTSFVQAGLHRKAHLNRSKIQST